MTITTENETADEGGAIVTKDPEKKKDNIYSILALLMGISLIAAGIIGIILSRTEGNEYKNSTDIRKVDAVIDEFSTKEDKDDNGVVTMTTYKFKISYIVNGESYKGKCEERVYARELTKKYNYDKLRRGDTISVEVYKAKNGDYKISPEGNPVYFLLYCAAIPVGIVISAVMAYDMLRKKSGKQNIGKATKSKGRKADR